jgi:hypothetical protein
MTEHLRHFRAWYVKTLESLYPVRDAGIAILMISTPLLERYLRQKNKRTPDDQLNDACMDTLRSIFSVLPDRAAAWRFWQIYRNGFLHQATLSLRTRAGTALPSSELTHDIAQPLAVRADGSFVLQPVLFSRRVVETIEGDFATFVGAGTPAPRLPEVVAYVCASSPGLIVPPITLSTRGG